jgi:hypothetical protein
LPRAQRGIRFREERRRSSRFMPNEVSAIANKYSFRNAPRA